MVVAFHGLVVRSVMFSMAKAGLVVKDGGTRTAGQNGGRRCRRRVKPLTKFLSWRLPLKKTLRTTFPLGFWRSRTHITPAVDWVKYVVAMARHQSDERRDHHSGRARQERRVLPIYGDMTDTLQWRSERDEKYPSLV